MATKTHKFYNSAERYDWDFGDCSPSNGFAQMDTGQDAWYYGNWSNPTTFTLVSYAEGDLDTTVCNSAEEFCAEIRKFVAWNNAEQLRFKGIDAMLSPVLEKAFVDLGLGDLLH